jgi:hypothetical protein
MKEKERSPKLRPVVQLPSVSRAENLTHHALLCSLDVWCHPRLPMTRIPTTLLLLLWRTPRGAMGIKRVVYSLYYFDI